MKSPGMPELDPIWKRVRQHCVTYTWMDTDGTLRHAASGVLIALQERLFVATCAHAIKRAGCAPRHFFGSTARVATDTIDVIRCEVSKDDQVDLAYMELSKEDVDLLGKTPCRLFEIENVHAQTADHYVLVIGAPYAKADTSTSAKKMSIGGVWGKLVPRVRRPEFGLPDSADEIGLVVEYPDGPHLIAQTGESEERISPLGMSGGGIWRLGGGRISYPGASKLIGIQSTWAADKNYLRGVQVLQWLRLIHSDYPDLRLFLEQEFPDIRVSEAADSAI